jgi:amidase
MSFMDTDALGLAGLVRNRDISALELVDEAIARAERLNPGLNAMVHRQYERARRDAQQPLGDGPFAGVPFLMKDYKGREAGEPYHAGNRVLHSLDYRPTTSSALALAFRRAGLIPIGRTNTPEMACIGTTEPELYGPTHNPWRHGYSPGGSSGGSAAAVAAGIVPAAHANDISGSIRIPAAHCGLVGLKTTRGRTTPSTPYEPPIGMNTEGVVTRSVRDTAALLDAITHTSPFWPAPPLERPLLDEIGRDPGRLRVAVWTEAFNGSRVDPANVEAAVSCARELEAMGHHVVEGAAPALSSPQLWSAARVALMAAVANEIHAWEQRLDRPFGEHDMESGTWAQVQAGRATSAVEVLTAIETMQAVSHEVQAWFATVDLLVTPTTAAPPTEHGEYHRNYESGRGSAFTRPFNVTGQPALSLPLGWPDDGLPRGVQLIAGYGREDILIQVGSALEVAKPWAHRRPPASALAG